MTANVRAMALMLVVAATTAGVAKEPVSIRVTPEQSFAPANVVIRASVEPDAANRAMEVVADGDLFYRSSTVDLDGDRAPKTMTFEFPGLPPGDYQVTVVLIGAGGRTKAMASARVSVIGPTN